MDAGAGEANRPTANDRPDPVHLQSQLGQTENEASQGDGDTVRNAASDRLLDVLIVAGHVTTEGREFVGDKDDTGASPCGRRTKKLERSEERSRDHATTDGFVAHAARAAHSLWHRVHLACVVDAPVPPAFERLLREISADTRYLAVIPAKPPPRIDFQRPHAHVRIGRPWTRRNTTPRLPRDVLDRFDVILVDPGAKPERSAILTALRRRKGSAHRRATVAIFGRADWDGGDFRATRECGDWLFFNSVGLIATARRVAPGAEGIPVDDCPCTLKNVLGSCRLVASLGACLTESVGACRLVASLGACGACLISKAPRLTYFPTAPMSSCDYVGAGDALMAVTALSAASGASDDVSVRRGVAAATGCMAGLPLPLRLEELDI